MKKIIVENTENLILVNKRWDIDKYLCYCTCGTRFDIDNYEKGIVCPTCGCKKVEVIYGRLGRETFNIVINNYKKYKDTYFVIEKKMFEVCARDVEIKLSDNTYEKNVVFEEKSNSKITVDYDFHREEKLEVNKDGVDIKTKTGKYKEITNIELSDAGSKYYINSGGTTLFNLVNRITGSKSISCILNTLDEYPEIEILYSTYGKATMLKYIKLKNIKSGAKKPHQILGLTKPMFKYFINLFDDEYRVHTYASNLNTAIEISKLYKSKPDLGDVLIRDVVENELTYYKYLKLINEENYNRDRLIRYLTNDLYTFQGIDRPDEGLSILCDYIKMCKDIGVPYIKYPDSLKKAHDVAVKNYKIQIDEIMKGKFINNVSSDEYKRLETNDIDGYTIIAPNVPDDVKKEGSNLHHCVASYISYIADGTSKILFMRNKKTPDLSLITLEVRGERLVQYKGSCNRRPSSKEMDAIKMWAKNKKLKIA